MPQEPIAPKEDEKGYFMTFRNGMSPFNFKGFKHRGDLKSARNRAFKHGQIMGYKNIWVFPWFVDLAEEERGQSSGSGEQHPSTEMGSMTKGAAL
jgi:hypothetical protein